MSRTKRKPALEAVIPEFGSSFSVKHFHTPCPSSKPRRWHFHKEYELVYVNGGCGKRHIGSHLSCFHHGDLVLVGSMLPHTGFIDRLTGNDSEVVVHFNENFLGEDFFCQDEMSEIKRLFERASAGIAFGGQTKLRVGNRLEQLAKLEPFPKLLELLSILQDLASTKEYTVLNAEGYAFETNHTDNDRINIVFDYVREHFKRAISLDEISEIAAMTVPAFCRYFKRVSGKTFTRFVNEMRVVEASRLLSRNQLSITNICFESGFNNFSHFNRVFKKITGQSPSAYRNQMTKTLQYSELAVN